MKTITGGSFQDSKGNPANGATITFVLLSPEVATNTGQVYPNTVSFVLDASGNLPAASQIWANDELTPTGSVYRVTVVSPSGQVLYGPQFWSIVGVSPISITNMIPSTNSGVFIPNPALTHGIVIPSGTINGTNTVFTLSVAPLSGQPVLVFLGGVLQNPGVSNDYTISGSTITFNTAPSTGPVLVVY